MIFGDVNDFAIQAEVEPELVTPSAPWGRMCVWCQGTALGNIRETHCGLECSTLFEQKCNHLEDFWDAHLTGLDDLAAFSLLDAKLYGDDDRTDEQVHADAERFWKFDFLTNWGEQFNGLKAFLICPPQGPLRIVFRLPNNAVGSSVVTKAGFLGAVGDFGNWFREKTKQLRR